MYSPCCRLLLWCIQVNFQELGNYQLLFDFIFLGFCQLSYRFCFYLLLYYFVYYSDAYQIEQSRAAYLLLNQYKTSIFGLVLIDNLREALFPNVMIVHNISIYFPTVQVQVSKYELYYCFSVSRISVYNISSSVSTSFFYTKQHKNTIY